MKTRVALLFAFALLCLGFLAHAAGTATPAAATSPAPVGFSATLSPAAAPGCEGAASSSDPLNLGPAGGFLPSVLICGTCSDAPCVGAAANAICGAGRKCFIITDCGLQPKTWRCTCSTIDP